MKTLNTSLTGAVVVALGLLLGAGCASSPKATEQAAEQAAPKDDLSSMQGTWTGQEVSGQPGDYQLTIAGNDLKFKAASPDEWYTGKLTLHPNTSPKQAEVLIEECSVPKYIKATAKALYKLEGSTLTITATEPGAETGPADFEPGSTTRVFVFKRQ